MDQRPILLSYRWFRANSNDWHVMRSEYSADGELLYTTLVHICHDGLDAQIYARRLNDAIVDQIESDLRKKLSGNAPTTKDITEMNGFSLFKRSDD